MDVNIGHENETQIIESEINKINKLNISDNSCSYCNKQFTELWYKDCDPFRIIEGWTSGNANIVKFTKDTIYNIRYEKKIFKISWMGAFW